MIRCLCQQANAHGLRLKAVSSSWTGKMALSWYGHLIQAVIGCKSEHVGRGAGLHSSISRRQQFDGHAASFCGLTEAIFATRSSACRDFAVTHATQTWSSAVSIFSERSQV
ncbi:hypothetical protein AC579_758 [Pseudocercospora musae]|nr:hypothetical protein AC579_758 [Pseudocercospora musae]KXT14883.1 hypothetical protein AC579_758 [Pseudocercospora musae]